LTKITNSDPDFINLSKTLKAIIHLTAYKSNPPTIIATIAPTPLIPGIKTFPRLLTKGTAPVAVPAVLLVVLTGTEFVVVGVVVVLFPTAGVLEGALVIVEAEDDDEGTVMKEG
jgi:hypothetical protein